MVSGYVWFGTPELLPQPKAPFSWTQLRRNQESDVWPMVSGTATVRWFLELRQFDGLWNCDSPMGSGVATILIECSASCWKRQFTARSSESTFHDYFHLVRCFDGFCVYTNWTMFQHRIVFSSRRLPFSLVLR